MDRFLDSAIQFIRGINLLHSNPLHGNPLHGNPLHGNPLHSHCLPRKFDLSNAQPVAPLTLHTEPVV
jgi:hypothetical protein